MGRLVVTRRIIPFLVTPLLVAWSEIRSPIFSKLGKQSPGVISRYGGTTELISHHAYRLWHRLHCPDNGVSAAWDWLASSGRNAAVTRFALPKSDRLPQLLVVGRRVSCGVSRGQGRLSVAWVPWLCNRIGRIL